MAWSGAAGGVFGLFGAEVLAVVRPPAAAVAQPVVDHEVVGGVDDADADVVVVVAVVDVVAVVALALGVVVVSAPVVVVVRSLPPEVPEGAPGWPVTLVRRLSPHYMGG